MCTLKPSFFTIYYLIYYLPRFIEKLIKVSSPLANVQQSLPVNKKIQTTDIAGGEVCRRDLYTNRVVYLKTFLIAASNIPGAITSIVCIDKIGRRNLLGKNFFHAYNRKSNIDCKIDKHIIYFLF